MTGSLISVTAWQSEQMRPRQVLRGSLPSLRLPTLPLAGRLPALAGVGAGALLVSVLRKRSAGRGQSSHDQAVTEMAAASRTRDSHSTTWGADGPVNPDGLFTAAPGPAVGDADGLVVTGSTM